MYHALCILHVLYTGVHKLLSIYRLCTSPVRILVEINFRKFNIHIFTKNLHLYILALESFGVLNIEGSRRSQRVSREPDHPWLCISPYRSCTIEKTKQETLGTPCVLEPSDLHLPFTFLYIYNNYFILWNIHTWYIHTFMLNIQRTIYIYIIRNVPYKWAMAWAGAHMAL